MTIPAREIIEEPDEPDDSDEPTNPPRQARPPDAPPSAACSLRIERLGIVIDVAGDTLPEAHAAAVDLLERAVAVLRNKQPEEENGYR